MQIVIQGKNFVVSDRIREYVEEKIGRLDRYLPDIHETRVEITKEQTKSTKDSNVVQVTLRANGKILRAEDRGEAIYACIDTVSDKIHRQIVRYKGKRRDRRQGAHHRKEDQYLMPDLDPRILEEIAEEQERQVVRTKRFVVHPMSVDEAIEQMELLEHNFFVFFNAEEGRTNVIYRRSDKNYGLIDPELA